MKAKIWRILTTLFILLPVSTRASGADTSKSSKSGAISGAARAERLPGSDLSVQEALDRANLVFVARVTHSRRSDRVSISGGRKHDDDMKVEVVRSLKGDAKGELSVSISAVIGFKNRAEGFPEEGQSYLFFIKQPNARQRWTVKVIRLTEPMLRQVEGLVSERPLPGSDLKLREAAEYAPLVVVAKIIQVKEGGPSTPERAPYHVKIRIAQALKGEAAGEHFVFLLTRVAPNGQVEKAPEEGRDYLFFIAKRPGEEWGGVKVVRPTEEVLPKIREFLAGD